MNTRTFRETPIGAVINLINRFQSPGMKVAEIGVHDGTTTIGYIDTIKKNNGTLFALDTFVGTVDPLPHGNNFHFSGSHNIGLFDLFKTNLQDYMDIIVPIVGDSMTTISLLPSDMDIIFIDGNHIYSAVKNDIKISLTKIKKGGIICGHDCEKKYDLEMDFSEFDLSTDSTTGHCGVIKALYDIFSNDYILEKDTVWWKQL